MKKLFAIISCFVVLACGSSNETVGIKTLEPGDTAPNFKLKNVNGKMISPDDYPNAKGIIVVFTCNTCPVATEYEDRLIALGNKYHFSGYPVIAINANKPGLLLGDSFESMQERANEKGFSFPYLYDEGQEVTNQYGARVTPHIFLLKKEGSHYKVMYTGALDNDTWNENPDKDLFVEDAITDLEAGKEIKVTSTKAIGCTVKRG